MANKAGMAIVIKAFLPTGKDIDAQFNAFALVKKAQEEKDYAELLKAAQINDVRVEYQTRREKDAG